MATAVPLLLVALVIILFASELFTNGVEWVGVRLGLGHGAVGSVLAAFGTAMPETMIPLIAIIFIGSTESEDVGIGAILGAPFLLSTAAFAVTGTGLLLSRARRTHGLEMHFDASAIRRDFSFFFLLYIGGVGGSFLPLHWMKLVIAALSLGGYAFYVYKAISNSGEAGDEEDLEPLRLHRAVGGVESPPTFLAWAQVSLALGMVIGAAYLFVHEIEIVSELMSIPALVLAIVIAPLATELPETFNSVIWLRENKDTLAMGNVSGAMVFQSSIPVSIGMIFTPWELNSTALVAAVIALASTGIVFYYVTRKGFLTAPVLLRAGLLWVAFVIYVVAKTSLA